MGVLSDVNWQHLFPLIAVSWGIVNVLTKMSGPFDIFEHLRQLDSNLAIALFGESYDKKIPQLFGLHCSACVGFWSGAFISLIFPYIETEFVILSMILNGFLVSGICWILFSLIVLSRSYEE